MSKKRSVEKKSFILYGSYAEPLSYLTTEEKGLLLEAIYEYEMTGAVPQLPTAVAILFATVRANLDRDREKYEEVARDNSRKARLRWERKAEREREAGERENRDAAAFSALPSDAERCLYDNDNDNDNENGNKDENANDNGNADESEGGAEGRGGSAAERERTRISERLFEQFWSAYPLRIHRERARAAWRRFVGESEERARRVLAALSRAKTEDFRFRNGHVPSPSNWLKNDEPWLESYAPPPDLARQARQSGSCSPPASSSFDTDEFFNRALERSYGQR